MSTSAAQAPENAKDWRSLSLSDFAAGYAVNEAASRFSQERLAEHALRLAGVFTMLAGIIHWFLPKVTLGGSSVQMRLLLTVLFVATGVTLYAFASRGFRRMLHIDLGQRQVTAARMNSSNQSRRRRDFPMQDVTSIYVRRSGTRQGQATLNIRLKSQSRDIELLAGEQAEVETLHERLCQDLQTAMDCGPKRVRPGARARAGKPSIRPTRSQPQTRRSPMLAVK